MLFLVGIGLSDPRDITVKGLDIVKKAHKVFLESYTSILCYGSDVQALVSYRLQNLCLMYCHIGTTVWTQSTDR